MHAATTATEETTLLIHMGGLGDICCSESVFLSLAGHAVVPIQAVGNHRVLDLFGGYFTGVDTIERRRWAYLFSADLPGERWGRIVFIGKDRSGSLRERLSTLTGDFLLIDMFPDTARTPVEDYQLTQLAAHGVQPIRKERHLRDGDRLILYPENPYLKEQWPIDRFLHLYERMREDGRNAVILRPPELELPIPEAVAFEGLEDIRSFFSDGGSFFSNDSGMAHFAAACGLRVLTLFFDADPCIWQPKGSLALDCRARPLPGIEEVARFIHFGTQNPTVSDIRKCEA